MPEGASRTRPPLAESQLAAHIRPCERILNLAGLRSALAQVPPSQPVVLHVGRGGQLRFLALTLE